MKLLASLAIIEPMQTVIIVLVFYFVAIAALSSLKATEINWRIAIMIRAFFPSWKFFEDYADIPKVFFRTQDTDEWRIVEEPLHRSLFKLVFNPKGNQALAFGSLVQQLLFDLNKTKDVPEFEKTTSYALIQELVRRRLGPNTVTFQFKVANIINGKHDDILISPRFKYHGS